jgi:O-antigen/teichoic acid export membrane protein
MTLIRVPAVVRRGAHSPSIFVVSRVAAAGLSVATAVVVARSLGLAGRGLTAAVIAALAVVPLVSGLGLSWAVRRETILSDAPAEILRTTRLLSLVSLVPAGAATTVLLLTSLASLPGDLTVVLVIGMAATPLVVVRNAQIGVLLALRRFGQVALATLAQQASYTVLLVAVAVATGLTPARVVLLYVLSVVASAAFTGGLLRISWRGPRVGGRRLLATSVRSIGAEIGEILSYRLDQLLLLPLIGSAQLGAYAVAVNVALLPMPVGQALAANSFESVARSGGRARASAIRENVSEAASLGLLAGMAVAVVAPSLPWVFGAGFAAARLPAVLLAVGTVLVVVTTPATSALIASGRSGASSLAQLVGTGAGIALMYVLAPDHGAVGAAAAAVGGYLVTLGFSLWRLGCSPWALVPRAGAGRTAFRRLTGMQPGAPTVSEEHAE